MPGRQVRWERKFSRRRFNRKRSSPLSRSTPRVDRPHVLTINGGSSSIRFAVYEAGETLRRCLDGKVDIAGGNHRAEVNALLDHLEAQPVFAKVRAVGHRVVHGMKHVAPERVTPRLLAELRRIT